VAAGRSDFVARSTTVCGPPSRMAAAPALNRRERRTITLLGVPTMALALAVTAVTTYAPVVAESFGGSILVIGIILGIEGLLALWLPLVAGTWSDGLHTRLGGRLPFLIVASPLVVVGLAGVGLVHGMGTLALAALVFFLGYFLAYEPYRALYPDVVGDDAAGRAQGTQALWRGVGTGAALLGGGLLLSFGQLEPFLAAAAVYGIAMVLFGVALARRGVPDPSSSSSPGGVGATARRVRQLIRGDAALKSFLAANALWELSLAALKTFVVLYVTKGLGHSRSTAALIIGGVAVLVLGAAFAGGRAADRFGHFTVLRIALPIYGLGLLVPFLVTQPWLIAVSVPFIAIGGGALTALPYAVLMPLMPEDEHGLLTGYYSFSRGLGTWLGPLLGGLAITALAPVFTATQGYQAVWAVCSLAVLLSLWPLRRLRRHVDEPAETPACRPPASARGRCER
jgi:MFS family permease